MNALALDLGSHVGWAIYRGDGVKAPGLEPQPDLESGVYDLKLSPLKGREAWKVEHERYERDVEKEHPGARYVRFQEWLYQVIAIHGLSSIAYEMPHLRGGYAARMLTGLEITLLAVSSVCGVVPQRVHPLTLKKWTTGSGRASKEQMIAAVSEKWKPVTDPDEADALAVLMYSLANLAP